MGWDEQMDRSGGACEFYGASDDLASVDVSPEDQVLLCGACLGEGEVNRPGFTRGGPVFSTILQPC